MNNTSIFGLPLVQAAQAQKHVTVNEALARLDGALQLRLHGLAHVTPPAAPADGEAYDVGPGATGAWAGEEDKVALAVNGLWVFLTPLEGWEAYDLSAGARVRWQGGGWRRIAPALASNGAETRMRVVEADVTITSGATFTTADLIPSHAQVIGVTARVTEAIAGAGISSWSLGVAGSDNRYGSGLGLAVNSYVRGLTGQPVTYWSDTPLVLTPDAGSFTSGRLALAIHLTELSVPDAV